MPNSSGKLKVGIIGKDGRTSAIETSLIQSARIYEVVRLSNWKGMTLEEAIAEVLSRARETKPDLIIIGPEEPLAEGIVDLLQEELGIPCIGPSRLLAQLESSKAFTRQLLSQFKIPGNPEFRVFRSLEGIREYLIELGGYVVKPDGLTGGKGVKISDAHLFSIEDALDYCKELLAAGHQAVVVEEKLDGEEFSLMSFCDGTHIKDTIVVQDHKRAGEGDTGANTGGMGSYSCSDHSLPFLSPEHIKEASAINAAVGEKLYKKTGQKYKGILYGGFMVTKNGLRLLEYNARFGDPETLNVLALLETDFGSICEAIVNETLDTIDITFKKLASVCKYVVPNGYPDNPVKDKILDIRASYKDLDNLRIYEAAVEKKSDGIYNLTGSRAIAFVGIGETLEEAEAIAEKAACSVRGPVFHRKDIGTQGLINQRIEHIKSLNHEVIA